MNPLQIIKTIPKFGGENFAEWTRYFNDILGLSRTFRSKMISRFERPELILRGSRKREENTCDYDNNGSNPNDVSRIRCRP